MSSQSEAELKALRVDHIGSLVRPEKLRYVFARYDRGEAAENELRQAQDEAIRDVIAKQEAHGLPVVNNGEFRATISRRAFQPRWPVSMCPRMPSCTISGRKRIFLPSPRAEQDFNAPGPAIITRRPVVKRLRIIRNEPLEEFKFVEIVATRPVKLTLIGPDRICQRFAWEKSQNVYKDLDRFMEDVVAIAAFAAASLTGADPMRTGFAAVRFGWMAYVIPFLFVASPNLLMQGAPLSIGLTFATAVTGVWLVSASIVGYFKRPLAPAMRMGFAVAGLLLLFPSGGFPGTLTADLVGFVLAILLVGREAFAVQRLRGA